MAWRRLTSNEERLVAAVFCDKIDLVKVRLFVGPWPGLAMTVGSTVFFPRSVADIADFAAGPLEQRVWFIHEMTHVWQFQRRPCWTLGSWFWTLVTGGYGPRRKGYRYPAAPRWRRLNLEQQAEVVADAYRWAATGSSLESDAAALHDGLREAGLEGRLFPRPTLT